MAHENARAGFSKLFTAQILSIIAACCSLLTLIPGIGTVLGGAAMGILGLIAYIMTLVGLNQAGKDEELVKSAFTLSIFLLILGVASGVLLAIFPSMTWISSVVNILSTIINLVIIHHVLFGGANLNSALTDKAAGTWKAVLIIIVLDILVAIGIVICGVITNETAGGIVAIIVIVLTLVDAVLDVVSYIMYLTFLGRAKNEV